MAAAEASGPTTKTLVSGHADSPYTRSSSSGARSAAVTPRAIYEEVILEPEKAMPSRAGESAPIPTSRVKPRAKAKQARASRAAVE